MKGRVTVFIFIILSIVNSLIIAQNSGLRGNKAVDADSSKSIQEHKSKSIDVYKSGGIQPYTSKQIESKKSNDISVHKAKEIDVYKGKEIDTYKSKNIDTYKPGTIKPGSTGTINSTPKNAGKIESNKKNITEESKNNIESLIGRWHTRVPGAVWQTPSGREGYDNLHVSSGVKSGDLVINANGTYVWNSYGGKKGNWVKGDSGYPIVLIDKSENKKWKVGYDSKHTGGRDIIIWDGNVWYDGKK